MDSVCPHQKELSDLYMPGLHATQYAGGYKNWHKENMENTLKALTALGNGKTENRADTSVDFRMPV